MSPSQFSDRANSAPSRQRWCLLLIILAVWMVAGAANAGKAEAHIESAKRQYHAGLYDAAIQSYAQAYVLKPHTTLIFNLAQAHRQAQKQTAAIELYERYLRLAPRGLFRAEALSWLEKLRGSHGAQPAIARLSIDAVLTGTVRLVLSMINDRREGTTVRLPRPRWRKLLGGLALGAGLVLAAVGSAALIYEGRCLDNPFGRDPRDAQDPMGLCSRVYDLSPQGATLIGLGGLLSIGGIVTLAIPGEHAPARDELRLGRVAVVGLTARF